MQKIKNLLLAFTTARNNDTKQTSTLILPIFRLRALMRQCPMIEMKDLKIQVVPFYFDNIVEKMNSYGSYKGL